MVSRAARVADGLRRHGFDRRFVVWTLLMVAGHAYVAMVINGRAHPFEARHGGYGEFLRMLPTLPVLYWLGARHALAARETARRAVGAWLLYALPFFLALHWEYLGTIPHVNYSLTAEHIARMNPIGRAVFLAAGLLIAALAAFHVRLAHREGYAGRYLGAFAAAIAFIAAVTWLLHDTHYLHVHHYFLFGFFVPFARFRHPVSVACAGLCAGVYVEGISTWSLATIWHARG